METMLLPQDFFLEFQIGQIISSNVATLGNYKQGMEETFCEILRSNKIIFKRILHGLFLGFLMIIIKHNAKYNVSVPDGACNKSFNWFIVKDVICKIKYHYYILLIFNSRMIYE